MIKFIFFILFMISFCAGFLTTKTWANDNAPVAPGTPLTTFIKATSNYPLVLNPRLMEGAKKKEEEHGATAVGSVVDNVLISRVMAQELGYLPVEGQSVNELKNYPELVIFMNKKGWSRLPDERLGLIRKGH
jgi:hypothetical protein